MSSPPPLPFAPPFLDVATLIENSHPRLRPVWTRFSLPMLIVILVSGSYISSQSGHWASLAQSISSLLAVVLIVSMAVAMSATVRGQRREQAALGAIEELIQLRRWSEAGLAVQNLLIRPTRSPWARVQALIFLSGVLMRYHRFLDAISVQDYLLERLPLDGGTVQALRLGRAMALLREDRLFDADRAISDLRRQAFRSNTGQTADDASGDPSGDAVVDESAPSIDETSLPTPLPATVLDVPWKSVRAARSHGSAGLALVELYRDVKTGHPEEAVKLFFEKLVILRGQLGHRVADAYVLVAKAYDLMNQSEDAARMYLNATLLAPAPELHRRFPETTVLATKYPQSPAPRLPSPQAL